VLAIQQIGGDDLVVVPAGVGEGAATVAVAQRPDAGNRGSQLVVHDDVPPLVQLYARMLQAEIVRVGAAPGRDQQVRPSKLGRAAAIDRHDDVVALLGDAEALRVDPDSNAFLLQDLGNRR